MTFNDMSGPNLERGTRPGRLAVAMEPYSNPDHNRVKVGPARGFIRIAYCMRRDRGVVMCPVWPSVRFGNP